MKVAVVGCGTMGTVHGTDYHRLPGVELTGVCDLDRETARELAGQVETKAYFSFEDMMAEAEIDVVSIALPTNLHKEYVMKAADLGKHVICEKPIALTLEDAEEMIAYCQKKGVRLFIGHVVRFFPEYADLKRKLDSGVTGEPGVAHLKRVGSHPGTVKDWYNDFDKSHGVIMDMMIHDIDFARWAYGEVQEVFALNRRSEEQDYALVTLRFESGAIANLEGHWGYPGTFATAAEFAGKGGIIRLNSRETDSLKLLRSSAAPVGARGVQVPKSPSYQDPYYYELEHFLACIREDKEPLVSAEDALRALEIVLAALESARTGQPVRLPLKGGVTG
ncbi:Gfo/Idh/MocA family oxidoreductase [Paenibacillus chitinolyticus]|uniref:Gfo/Idh/MocA family protein n=1 Tax=Paenibacillus chitinolyticus TaxID=79263 RepID=UPI002DBD7780|nr:Gfo/Idh/MocA family oxidoreductase [Paenibacillus chitinolyticus]MEC0246989.1 Gfo/Idh/MocA family oxidoreductase [Paenibacillus chitinolyticus]